VCDIGTKNFCYILCKDKVLIDFEIVQFDKKKLIEQVINMMTMLDIDKCFVENQVFSNTVCIKIQTIIETYCHMNKIYCKKVSPTKKFNVLNIDHSSYDIRKKNSVKYGTEYINKMNLDQDLLEKINRLKKKDDFYDCILMMITEF
jgi:hypothetical protein